MVKININADQVLILCTIWLILTCIIEMAKDYKRRNFDGKRY